MAVIGAGPAGIALGAEAGQAGLAGTVILEKAGHPCDTVVSLYRKGKRVDAVYRDVAVAPEGVLSFENMTREAFLDWIEGIIADYGLDIRYNHEVVDIRNEENRFHVLCSNGTVIEAATVVIAIGIFGKPVKPSYRIPPDVKNRIYFNIPEKPPTGQNLLVVGGGDSAAEAACYLSRLNRVTLSYRRGEFFRINEQNLCSLNECCSFENLETRLGVDIAGIAANGTKVRVRYTDEREELYDAVFYFLGGSTPRLFLEKVGVAYAGNRPVAGAHGETNIPGLFLAGDLVAAKGTIMTAFNSAAAVVRKIAASSAAMIK